MSEETPQVSKSAQLFPLGREVKLANGSSVEVNEWSIQTMVRVTQRVPKAVEQLMDGRDANASVVELFPGMLDEIKVIVAESIGWEPARIEEEMTSGDLLRVANAVWDVCISGPLAEAMGLATRLGGLIGGLGGTVATTPTSKAKPSSAPSAS